MCYDFKFDFDDSYKACKFTAFPRTFQIINYLFFKEVYNLNSYSGLHEKKTSPIIQRLFQSILFLCELLNSPRNQSLFHNCKTLIIHRINSISRIQGDFRITMVFGIRYDESRPIIGSNDAVFNVDGAKITF